MNFSDVPTPEVYRESADFRFFLRWIELCLSELQNKTENLIDLLDPLRCPTNLLWLLGDTCGYKYDERAIVAMNRLVILHFAEMIRNRGSLTGMSLAAELNLAQLSLIAYAKENPILEERLEDTSVPANAVSITPHPDLGFIDVVYYSEQVPTDVCIEYVRPVGMYCFSHAGVAVNARTKVSVDARLTNMNDGGLDFGPSFVAHYRRADYASLQRFVKPDGSVVSTPEDIDSGQLVPEKRKPVYYRNSDYEGAPTRSFINPGLRSLYSLQLCNNEHIVKALLPSLEQPDEIFSMGYGPQEVGVVYPDNYLKVPDHPLFNLRLDRGLEESFTPAVYTVESAESVIEPRPAVNPVMVAFGDAISLNDMNTKYTKYHSDTGEITVVGEDNDSENNG